MQEDDWSGEQRLALLFSCHADQKNDSPVIEAVAILYNAAPEETLFTLPPGVPAGWTVRFSSNRDRLDACGTGSWKVPARCTVLVTSGA